MARPARLSPDFDPYFEKPLSVATPPEPLDLFTANAAGQRYDDVDPCGPWNTTTAHQHDASRPDFRRDWTRWRALTLCEPTCTDRAPARALPVCKFISCADASSPHIPGP